MAEPLVVQVMRRFKAGLLAREREQMRRMARRWLEVAQALEGEIEALAAELAGAGQALGDPRGAAVWKLYKMERYQRLLARTRAEMRRWQEYAEGEITGQQRELARLGVREAQAAIRAAARVEFNLLPVEAVEAMAGLTAEGSPLWTLLQRSWPDAVEGLTKALMRGVALGWSPRKTAKAMQAGLGRGLERTLKIARSEQMRAYREASREQFRQSGVVSGYQRLATKDARTCLACLMADGELYSVDETLRDHVSGRCTMVPVVAGMAPLAWQTGREWFEAQPAAAQRTMMGPGRYQAWQDGKFGLEDLVTVTQDATWGEQVRPTALRDLATS